MINIVRRVFFHNFRRSGVPALTLVAALLSALTVRLENRGITRPVTTDQGKRIENEFSDV